MPRPLIPHRRDRILDAAESLMLEHGWEHTTIAEIASHAGIGKGAVYREFADKSTMLDAVLNRSMRRMTRQVHQRVERSPEPADLPCVYRHGVEALLDDPLMRALLSSDSTVLGQHVTGTDNARYQLRFDWLTAYITELQHAHVIDAAVPVETIATMLSTFTIGLLHTPATMGAISPEQLRAAVTLFADVVSRGLADPEPIDRTRAHQARSDLLRRLETQLEEST